MGTYFQTDEKVHQNLIDYHAAIAKGGCGLNIVEVAAVHPSSRGAHYLGIYDDSFLPGLTALTRAIHEAGGKASIQLWHAGRMTNTEDTRGIPIVAASPIPAPFPEMFTWLLSRTTTVSVAETPKELTKSEIKEIVEAYGDAALRAKKAGFDCVELHGSSGYLLANFMSPLSNIRTDEYGGSPENRFRFAGEVIADIRRKTGKDFPIIYRISGDEMVEGGMKIEYTVEMCKLLEKAGVDAIDAFSGAGSINPHAGCPPLDVSPGCNIGFAIAIKKVVKIPVGSAGRINDPVLADNFIKEGKADFVDIGRGQIADHQFCNKAQRGDFDSITKCIGCNQGCLGRLAVGISCLRDPSVGREVEYTLKTAEKKKKILVAGGGPAGLEAARTLKARGHDVTLCEKSGNLGGQFYLAGLAPRKQEMADAALQMGRMAEKAGVVIKLDTPLTKEILNEIKPDEVVVATGSDPLVPKIPGVDKSNVMTAIDVIRGIKETGKSVVVIGGGLVGMETAEYLSARGKKVTIVEMLDEIGKDLNSLRKPFVFEALKKDNVEVYVSAVCREIKDQGIIIEQNGGLKEISGIDTIVIATGAKSNNNVTGMLKEMNYTYHVIGDAKNAGKALDAIWDGAELARAI
jgi:2,4-dienoyl-CoA reductase-like NADH-dependent reductase (Old Yellow Enzyme family)/thioredoxin reductase